MRRDDSDSQANRRPSNNDGQFNGNGGPLKAANLNDAWFYSKAVILSSNSLTRTVDRVEKVLDSESKKEVNLKYSNFDASKSEIKKPEPNNPETTTANPNADPNYSKNFAIALSVSLIVTIIVLAAGLIAFSYWRRRHYGSPGSSYGAAQSSRVCCFSFVSLSFLVMFI